jgi:GMP synthase-like glutamine amidotransferase
VVVLGSDRSVLGDEAWIAAELAWLRDACATVPVLGICFGAQALAVALGGAVRRERPEIDWLELEVDPALGCGTGPWLCWHNDFITPPPGAQVLARSGRAVHAFRAGPHLAVQFHPEVTPGIVAAWTGAEGLSRDLARAGVDACALERRTRAFAPEAGLAAHDLFDAFAAQAAGAGGAAMTSTR